MLDNIISDAAERAFTTLRRTGFVGGLSREIAAEAVKEARSDINDTPYYYYCTNDDDGCYAISAQWDDMPNATRHFANDE